MYPLVRVGACKTVFVSFVQEPFDGVFQMHHSGSENLLAQVAQVI
ncbi:MAG TPA: hypothetical protein VIG24_08320 [Acidimicrobiia bacterium]